MAAHVFRQNVRHCIRRGCNLISPACRHAQCHRRRAIKLSPIRGFQSRKESLLPYHPYFVGKVGLTFLWFIPGARVSAPHKPMGQSWQVPGQRSPPFPASPPLPAADVPAPGAGSWLSRVVFRLKALCAPRTPGPCNPPRRSALPICLLPCRRTPCGPSGGCLQCSPPVPRFPLHPFFV